jgi:hypothetical protein
MAIIASGETPDFFTCISIADRSCLSALAHQRPVARWASRSAERCNSFGEGWTRYFGQSLKGQSRSSPCLERIQALNPVNEVRFVELTRSLLAWGTGAPGATLALRRGGRMTGSRPSETIAIRARQMTALDRGRVKT